MLIANVCTLNPALTDTFEGLLFPPFQQVLISDVEVVLAQLLDMNPSAQLSAAYQNLFPVLLTPALWDRISTVPAIVKLLESYLRKAPATMQTHTTGAALVGLTLLVTDTFVGKDAELLDKIFPAISKLLDVKEDTSTTVHKTEDEILIDLEETGYDAGYTSLHFASSAGVDYAAHIGNGRQMCLESISRQSHATPHFVRGIQ
ncbi:hypothetical protein DYB36_009832 [Aphanomyces astaci]|uniref:Exportin-2 C-terminal domain-containing protein n=1 Tax=Aphanomyces astaci TaxID=112090 RepID=A0A397B1B6_APHAT|nr:hypothetical protein DYB36_009832 [Aphanomyces astaci]